MNETWKLLLSLEMNKMSYTVCLKVILTMGELRECRQEGMAGFQALASSFSQKVAFQ